jgi:hypothetical protein
VGCRDLRRTKGHHREVPPDSARAIGPQTNATRSEAIWIVKTACLERALSNRPYGCSYLAAIHLQLDVISLQRMHGVGQWNLCRFTIDKVERAKDETVIHCPYPGEVSFQRVLTHLGFANARQDPDATLA